MDPINPGMPGPGGPGVVPPPPGGMPPPPPPMGGPVGGDDPHSEVMAALKRIEDKLSAIATKVGA